MAIAETYQNYLLQDIIKDLLEEGESPTYSRISAELLLRTKNKPLSEPIFEKKDFKTTHLEHASASKYNETFELIQQDLGVSYTEMFRLTGKITNLFDRWRTESVLLESRIKNAQLRLTNLANNLSHRIIADDFVDASKVDMVASTAKVDLVHQTVYLDTTNTEPTRVFLTDAQKSDAKFAVLSRTNLITTRTETFNSLFNAFDDKENFWQTKVFVRKSTEPVTTELLVRIAEEPTALSKIYLSLHSANTTSSVQITPLLSEDNINFSLISTDNPTVSVMDKVTFVFPSTNAKYVKFLFTKNGYDFIENNNFIYEFGANEIVFFNEQFDDTGEQTLQSTSLFVTNPDQSIYEFTSVELEACERVPEDTDIKYQIAVSNTEIFSPTWISIDPIERPNSLYPGKLHLGEIDNITLPRSLIAYDPYDNSHVNPAKNYSIVTVDGAIPVYTAIEATDVRYRLPNSNDRLLNYQISNEFDPKNIEIFRNIGLKNTSLIDYTSEVRGVRNGWFFAAPYYSCLIEVLNVNGLSVNVGSKTMILDGVPQTGSIKISQGIHKVKIHENNWINIPGQLATLTDMKNADPLFPFNHKHLIEGYGLEDANNPYNGVDILAEFYMQRVSIADMLDNVKVDDYMRFATDLDYSESPTLVFVVKSDASQSDFLDEQFTIRFDIQRQMYKYLKFKAILNTNMTNITPNLDGYKLRLGKD